MTNNNIFGSLSRIWGICFILFSIFGHRLTAQCDYITNITGIVQSVPPVGDAANPALYTHVYVLVDNQGNIYATASTPDFMNVDAGFYNLYAVNYINTEAAAVLPLLAVGQPWFNVTVYGNDDVNNCLDYTLPYGSGCPIVVCETMTICEFDTLRSPSFNYNTSDHTQRYCLVCNDIVLDINDSGVFPLQTYPQVAAGADCQLFAINFNNTDGNPVSVGSVWTTTTDAKCTDDCIDFIGLDLVLNGLSLASGNGLSTTVDWWNVADGCAGATVSTNGGGTFNVPANNWCVPAYDPGNIDARTNDDLLRRAMGQIAKFACTGALDLTQHTVFYTVMADPNGPATLEVFVQNPGGNITGIQAALYGPVNALCPTVSGGTFVDCDDSGTGSLTGEPLSDLTLTTTTNPGETYIVIVDTDGRDNFTISSIVTLLELNLRKFSGKKIEKNNVLEWETEKEEGLSHFELQRSTDGIVFEKLADIPAAGYSNVMRDYRYTDVLPGFGTKYYRLKLISDDQSFEYSNVVVLTRENSDNLGSLTVLPNPSNDGVFFVQYNSESSTALQYKVINMLGQTLKEGVSAALGGYNELKLEITDFPAGTYILSMTLNGRTVNERIVRK